MRQASAITAIDDRFGDIKSLRNEIWRCRRLLQADLLDAERENIENRLRELQIVFEELLETSFSLTLKL